MIRAFSLILALALCLGLCACGGKEEAPVQTTATPTETTIPVETTEPAPTICWGTDYYVDSFGDPTDEPYMYALVDGEFSNTATMGSELQVVIYFSNNITMPYGDVFSFRLLEYGEVKATFTKYDDINIQIKDAYGPSDNWELWGSAPNGDIYDTDTYISDGIFQALYVNKIDVPAIITIGSSTYKFTIPSSGFDTVYEEYKAMKK